jgi:hypothetical protein
MRNRDGYFTYDQIIEGIVYARADPVAGYERNGVLDHLNEIREKMELYHMDIIMAREVVVYDKWHEAIVCTYKILPTQFKAEPVVGVYPEAKISAPDFKDAECCGNCKHFNDLTGYDEMVHGECYLHTELHEDYDPVVKFPLELMSCDSVCNDFEMKANP